MCPMDSHSCRTLLDCSMNCIFSADDIPCDAIHVDFAKRECQLGRIMPGVETQDNVGRVLSKVEQTKKVTCWQSGGIKIYKRKEFAPGSCICVLCFDCRPSCQLKYLSLLFSSRLNSLRPEELSVSCDGNQCGHW